jgi:predicted transcriptional regulator
MPKRITIYMSDLDIARVQEIATQTSLNPTQILRKALEELALRMANQAAPVQHATT